MSEQVDRLQLKSLEKGAGRKKVLNLKVSSAEYAILLAKSNRYTNGNISAFVRESFLNYKPRKKDVLVVPREDGVT